MDPLDILDRLGATLRRYQFHIPEWCLWLFAGAAAVGMAIGIDIASLPLALCSVAAAAVAAVGIARWQLHRRCSRGGLVVPRFAAPGEENRQEEVQRIILASLQDNLTLDEARLVHGVPVVVGADERQFAIALRKRLRARFVLHGRIAPRGTGYSVYARVAQPIDPGVIHVDLVTRDVTYQKASWRNLITRLTSATDVIDEEYPLEFADELQAIVRGTAGQLAEDQDDAQRAERLLKDALSVAPTSTSHQIDLLRVALARAVFDQGREQEAIAMLRQRSQDPAAAPELHRNLERALFLHGGPNRSEASRREGERALRAAAAQRSDPQLPLSLYNLAMLTMDEAETSALLDELLRSKTHYQDAWYVRRQRGALYWGEAEAERQQDGLDAARPLYSKAARMYSQAIRRRPHFKVVLTRRSFDFFWYRTPPVLFANAAEAHSWAGHRLRWGWYEWRGRRRRDRWFKRAHRALKRQRWATAAELFEHVAMVRPDMQRTASRTWEAIALKQLGETQQAKSLWEETLAEDPGALSWRAFVVADRSYGLGPQDLPGDEPTEPDAVNALLDKLLHERSDT